MSVTTKARTLGVGFEALGYDGTGTVPGCHFFPDIAPRRNGRVPVARVALVQLGVRPAGRVFPVCERQYLDRKNRFHLTSDYFCVISLKILC